MSALLQFLVESAVIIGDINRYQTYGRYNNSSAGDVMPIALLASIFLLIVFIVFLLAAQTSYENFVGSTTGWTFATYYRLTHSKHIKSCLSWKQLSPYSALEIANVRLGRNILLRNRFTGKFYIASRYSPPVKLSRRTLKMAQSEGLIQYIVASLFYVFTFDYWCGTSCGK